MADHSRQAADAAPCLRTLDIALIAATCLCPHACYVAHIRYGGLDDCPIEAPTLKPIVAAVFRNLKYLFRPVLRLGPTRDRIPRQSLSSSRRAGIPDLNLGGNTDAAHQLSPQFPCRSLEHGRTAGVKGARRGHGASSVPDHVNLMRVMDSQPGARQSSHAHPG